MEFQLTGLVDRHMEIQSVIRRANSILVDAAQYVGAFFKRMLILTWLPSNTAGVEILLSSYALAPIVPS
jgi:hypothetical protein